MLVASTRRPAPPPGLRRRDGTSDGREETEELPPLGGDACPSGRPSLERAAVPPFECSGARPVESSARRSNARRRAYAPPPQLSSLRLPRPNRITTVSSSQSSYDTSEDRRLSDRLSRREFDASKNVLEPRIRTDAVAIGIHVQIDQLAGALAPDVQPPSASSILQRPSGSEHAGMETRSAWQHSRASTTRRTASGPPRT